MAEVSTGNNINITKYGVFISTHFPDSRFRNIQEGIRTGDNYMVVRSTSQYMFHHSDMCAADNLSESVNSICMFLTFIFRTHFVNFFNYPV